MELASFIKAGNKVKLPVRPRRQDGGGGTSSLLILNVCAASARAKEAARPITLGRGRNKETAPTIAKHFLQDASEKSLQSSFFDYPNYTNTVSLS